MNNKIVELLTPIGIPILYGTRTDINTFPIIVFNIIDMPITTMDDIDIWIKYNITINVIADAKDIIKLVDEVKKIMAKNQFRRNMCPSMIYDEKLCKYNQALVFDYYGEVIYSEE